MEIVIRDDFIKLGQLLKLAGIAENGAEAKEMVQGGRVKVNGETDLRRGRKIVPGDVVTFDNRSIAVKGRDGAK